MEGKMLLKCLWNSSAYCCSITQKNATYVSDPQFRGCMKCGDSSMLNKIHKYSMSANMGEMHDPMDTPKI